MTVLATPEFRIERTVYHEEKGVKAIFAIGDVECERNSWWACVARVGRYAFMPDIQLVCSTHLNHADAIALALALQTAAEWLQEQLETQEKEAVGK